VNPTSDLVDLKTAARFASRFAAAGPLDRSYLLDDLDANLEELVKEAEPLVEVETGFKVPRPAKARVLSRREWAEENVESMSSLMKPLLERLESRMADNPAGGFARFAYRPILGGQLGVVLGFLSQRVLGQFDLLAAAEDEVWFVGSNLVLMERRFGFIPRDFRLWVVLHELTHRAQFEGNPWLRDHFLDSVHRFLSDIDLDLGAFLPRLAEAVRSDDALPLGVRLLRPEQRAMFDQLQALMSLIEGHGNFVMDRIAEDLIPTAPRMRRTLREGGLSKSPFAKIIGKLLGLDMKRRQYEEGQIFCNEIFEAGGRSALQLAFSSAATLPSLEEIRNPQLWVNRSLRKAAEA
jgi:coenzyme F420 biosynthesis associated uncharacterized protein